MTRSRYFWPLYGLFVLLIVALWWYIAIGLELKLPVSLVLYTIVALPLAVVFYLIDVWLTRE